MQNRLSFRVRKELEREALRALYPSPLTVKSFPTQSFHQNFVSSKFNKSYFKFHYCFNFDSILHTTTRKLKNRDENLETEIFPSLNRDGNNLPSLNRDGKQFPSLFRDGKLNRDGKLFPSLFRHEKISVSKFPSLKMARYVPSKF